MWPLNIKFLPPPEPIQRADHVGAAFFDFLPRDVEVELLERVAHVLGHCKFLASGAGNVDHVATHRDEFFFFDLGEDALGQLRVERLVSVWCLSSAIFSVLGSQFSCSQLSASERSARLAYNLPFCQTEIVWVGTEFFVAGFCEEEVVFETQASAAGPVNSGFDRQNHVLAHRAGSGLMCIGKFVSAGAHAVADRMRGLSGVSAFGDACANQAIEIGEAGTVARESDTFVEHFKKQVEQLVVLGR